MTPMMRSVPQIDEVRRFACSIRVERDLARYHAGKENAIYWDPGGIEYK
ncbi:MAG: hypothetical protein AB4352_01375 [Hormoscilla sp.]